MDTATKPTMHEQVDIIETWMARVGLDVHRNEMHAILGEKPAVSIYETSKQRGALVEDMGEPTREPNSSLRVALWPATEARPFLVRAYFWFKDEHCSTCGR